MQQFASFAKHRQTQGGAGPTEVKLQSINLCSRRVWSEGEVTLQLFPKPSFRGKSGKLLHTCSSYFTHTFVSVSVVISHEWVYQLSGVS